MVGYAAIRSDMPRFFVDKNCIDGKTVRITGADATHISRSLRMAKGEVITVCDAESFEYDCVLEEFGEAVTARITEKREISSEPPYKVTLWQALPKGDKLDSIIQKAVECGVHEIRLFESAHCVVKSDAKSEPKKSERRNRIAFEAAKQCGRGIIPTVKSPIGFDEMLRQASLADLPLFCYEGSSTAPLGVILNSFAESGTEGKSISIVIGSEGGFSESEAKKARDAGMKMTGLGKRILRAETAPIFVLGAIVNRFELS